MPKPEVGSSQSPRFAVRFRPSCSSRLVQKLQTPGLVSLFEHLLLESSWGASPSRSLACSGYMVPSTLLQAPADLSDHLVSSSGELQPPDLCGVLTVFLIQNNRETAEPCWCAGVLGLCLLHCRMSATTE